MLAVAPQPAAIQRQVPIRSLRNALACTENIDLEAAGAVIVVRPG
jgi:hypothetical protein